MKRWFRRLVVVAAVAAVLVLLRLTVFRPPPIPVTVYRVEKGRVESTVVNSRAGTVKSRHDVQMSPGIAGLVAAIPVEKGQAVERGRVLLRLDDREYREQVRLAERSLDAARATEQQAALAAEQAERDRKRAEALGPQHLISDSDLETARTKAETAAAALNAAREQTKQAAASLGVAQATLEKTVMTAPFDGVVLDITVEVGEWISPSPPGVFIPPVIDVIDPASIYVEAPLDEADVARIRVGLPVRITMDAFRGRSFPGRLSYVSSYVETKQEQNRTLTVEAVFDSTNLPANVLAGLSADIDVILDARDDVLRIPTSALLQGNQVLVVRGNRLAGVTVATGLHNWEYAEITSGLSAGDRVVVSLDRPQVRAGARVKVTAEATR